MIYLRQLWKQKPEAWGPVPAVQAAIRENAGSFYDIDPALFKLALPSWPGKQIDYINFLIPTTSAGVVNKRNGLYFTNDDTLTFTDHAPLDNLGKFTVLTRMNLIDFTYADYIFTKANYNARVTSSSQQKLGFSINLIGDDLISIYSAQPEGSLDNLAFIWTGGTNNPGSQYFYRNGSLVAPDDNAEQIGGTVNDDSASNFVIGNLTKTFIDGFYVVQDGLSANKVALFHDNPYALIQPIVRRFYSISGGAGDIISVVCTDGFTFADSATKTAILQAAAVESINLSDSDENVAQFIAALVDSFTMVDLSGNTAKYPVSVSDAFSISDSTTALQKVIALVSDNVTFSDVSVVRADLTGIAEDNVTFAETLIANLHAQAIASEIINLSGMTMARADLTAQSTDNFTVSAITTTDVLGVLTGLCADTFTVSDSTIAKASFLASITVALGLSDVAAALLATQAQATDSFSLDDSSTWASIAAALVADGFVITGEVSCRADLVAALVDSMNLSDASATILTAYATATDGFTVSDTAFWAGITQAIASDSFTVSGSVTGLIKLLAQAAEAINFSDSGSVTATYNVHVNDAVEFATAISTIAQFRAAILDGFNVTATPMEVSRLPNGKVSVSFSMKTATVVFNIK